MISLRYHVVSLTAVLLALALGVVLGASALSGRLLGALTSDRDELSGQVSTLTGERAALDARLTDTERFVAATAPSAVRDALTGRTVAMITTADADPADVAAVGDLLGRSGAQVTGRLDLTDAVVAPDRADALRALAPRLLPAGAQLPPTADTGGLTGSLLGALVATRPGDRSVRATPQETVTALAALADAGVVRPVPPVAPSPAQLVVVVTGTQDDPGRGATLASLAGALDRSGAGAVLAGRAAGGAIGAARQDPALRTALSTVDALDRPSARVASVLALREQAEGRVGAYGPAAGSLSPPPAAPATS